MGEFRHLKTTDLSTVNSDTVFPESDYSIVTHDNKFVQLEYIPLTVGESDSYDVVPGLYVIAKHNSSMVLMSTSFVNDVVLEEFSHSKDLVAASTSFFNKLHIYKQYGIEVPKRCILLWGPPGTSKTTSIQNMTKSMITDNETLCVIWPTDKYEASTVKDFIKSFKYPENVKRMILIIEDIGGIEMDQVRIRSESSLLSLLDNKEKTFKIPVLILATTNHPEVFMGNLTNRPDRFDIKMEFGFPDANQRISLLDFFLKERVTDEMRTAIKSNKCQDFTPAHIREIALRMDLYEKTGEQVIKDMANEIEEYKKNFSKKKAMGFGFGSDD